MATGNISPAGKSFTGAAEYDLAQGKYAEQEEAKKPEILEQNFLFGNDYKDIGKQFRDVADYNKNVKSPVMKFSINFDPKEKLSDAQKVEFTKRVMKEMGIREDNHQYMITRHSDKAHDHHHILANRVGMDGKAIDYSHTIPKLEKSIDKVEKEMGLNNDLAKTRRYVFDENTEKGYKVQVENFKRNKSIAKNQARTKTKSLDEKKDFMRRTISKEMGNSKNLEEFKKNLQEKNISAEMRFDKSNKLTGVSFQYDNLSIKGSALGKEFKASYVENSVNKEYDLDKGRRDRELMQVMSKEEKIQFMHEKLERFNFREEKQETRQEQNRTQEIKELREETLKNLDKAIGKIEPYKNINYQTYEAVENIRKAVIKEEITEKKDLEQVNQMAKNHISRIDQEEKKIEQGKYDDFDARRAKMMEAKQEQEQDQEKKRGFRRN